MKSLSARDLRGETLKSHREASKVMYRKVLTDPGASDARKSEASRKLKAIRESHVGDLRD